MEPKELLRKIKQVKWECGLSHPDVEERRAFVEGLDAGDSMDILQIIRALGDSSYTVVITALGKLDPVNADHLTRMLEHLEKGDRSVKRTVLSLLDPNNPRHICHIIRATADEDSEVQHDAQDRLERFDPKGKASVMPLLSTLKEEKYRSISLYLLGECDTEILEDFLFHEDPVVKIFIAEILEKRLDSKK